MGNTATNHLFLANHTDYRAKVLVSPNKAYVIADLLIGIASIEIDGVGIIEAIGDIEIIWDAAQVAGKLKDAIEKITKLFDSHGMTVEAHSEKDVHDHKLYNPLAYFSASGWAALVGRADLTLTILLEGPKGKKLVQFDTNSDWSWVIHDTYVHTTPSDNHWKDDGSDYSYAFKT